VKPQQVLITASAALLISGSLLYIGFRPTTLLMFHWASAVGLMPLVALFRGLTEIIRLAMPAWIFDSLPFALYVASYVVAIEAIWYGSRATQKMLWILLVPAMAILSEIGQLIGVVPGTFDWRDLSLLIAAPILSVTATTIYANHATQRQDH
jgi:hypothetical protein